MKKLLLSLIIISLFNVSAFANELIPQVIKEQIEVAPGQTKKLSIPLFGNKLESIKICLSFNRHLQLNGEIEDIWFGSTSGNCTTLDQIGGVILYPNAVLALSCKNFDSASHICRVKAAIYTRIKEIKVK